MAKPDYCFTKKKDKDDDESYVVCVNKKKPAAKKPAAKKPAAKQTPKPHEGFIDPRPFPPHLVSKTATYTLQSGEYKAVFYKPEQRWMYERKSPVKAKQSGELWYKSFVTNNKKLSNIKNV